jgi:hypothetical protein
MEERIEKLTNELTEFIYHADNMGAEEMAKTIAKAIKKAARNNDLSDRNYFYRWISYYVLP